MATANKRGYRPNAIGLINQATSEVRAYAFAAQILEGLCV
jgi:hypothetical protein